jgi:hypothetical protein
MSKRGWFIFGGTALLGIELCVAGYKFLEKEWQKKVEVAKQEQRRCAARYARFKTPVPVRVLTGPPRLPDVWKRIWTDAFDRVREGQSEAEVEEVLGQPIYTRCDVDQAGDRFEGSVWQYTMWMPPDTQDNHKNNTIQIKFGHDGRVQDKSMMNVVTLYRKPVPLPSATATPPANGTATPAGSPATAVYK